MNSGKDSAECTMCRQLVHFEPSDVEEGSEVEESTSPIEVDEEHHESGELAEDEEDSDGLSIDDETLIKPQVLPHEKEPDVTPRMVKTSTAAISSGAAAALVEPAEPSERDEEKFRKMDEARHKTSSRAGHGTRSSKRRRVKSSGSSHDQFGWESDRRRRRRTDRVTMLFIGGTVAAMVALMVYLLMRGQGDKTESESVKMERLQQEQLLAQQAATMKGFLGEDKIIGDAPPEWHKEFNNSPDRFMRKLRPIMSGFLEAKNWEDRLGFCADAEKVRPLMENYYKDNDDGPIGYQEIFSGGSVSLGEFFITARLLMDDYSTRGFVMLRGDDGTWSVDWESFVGYSSMGMEEFKKVRPTEPQLFRLLISRPRPGYFNYEFSEEESWDCYLLVGSEIEQILYAYVKKFGEAAADLNKIFAIHQEAAVTVMIRYPNDAPSANQVEIVEVVGEGWVPSIMRKSDDGKR